MRTAFNRVCILFLMLTLTFTLFSCEDEFTEDTLPEITTEDEMPDMALSALPPESSPGESSRRVCFTYNFPIEIARRNGSVLTTGSPAELRQAVRRIRSTNQRANFVYPFDVTLAGGRQVTIESFFGFRRLFRACHDFDAPDVAPCFILNYPINVSYVGRDAVVTTNNRVELARALRGAGRTAGRIAFPIEITYADAGEIVSVGTAAELSALRHACFQQGGEDDRGQSCYRVLFPIDLTVADRRVTVVDRQEWIQVIRRAGRRVSTSINYPITLQERESDAELIINGREEWAAAREACGE